MNSSSSSDEEENQRLKEAVRGVLPATRKVNGSSVRKGGKNTAVRMAEQKPSLRNIHRLEDEDSNELNVTPEFRTHVAKKLSKILDSNVELIAAQLKAPAKQESSDESDDFKLFSTSQKEDPAKLHNNGTTSNKHSVKKFEESSSDSESEDERLRSVAVSADDILKHSGFNTTPIHSQNSELVDTAVEKKSLIKKKKRKKSKQKEKEDTCTKSQDEGSVEESLRITDKDIMNVSENGNAEISENINCITDTLVQSKKQKVKKRLQSDSNGDGKNNCQAADSYPDDMSGKVNKTHKKKKKSKLIVHE